MFLNLDQAAQYLSVSVDTIKRYVEMGEIPTYKLERAVRFKTEDLDSLISRNFEVLLTKGLRARVSHVAQLAKDMEAWRVIVEFIDTSDPNRGIVPFGSKIDVKAYFTEYLVYVDKEFLEAVAKLPGTQEGAEKWALRFIKTRFEQTADTDGNKDITRIEEMQAACHNGECSLGETIPLPTEPRKWKGLDEKPEGF